MRGLWLVPAGAILLVGLLLARQADDTPNPAQRIPQPTASDIDTISWQDVTGMGLPISSIDGPHCLSRTRAACFGQTRGGAALAAAHLLTRTFAFVGPRTFTPTIADQVVGPDAAALQRLTARAYAEAVAATHVPEGEPLGADNGWLVGFHLDAFAPGQADVTVLFRQSDSDGQTFAAFPVHLEWRSTDWALEAPRWGDWQGVATAVTDPDPDYYRSYDTLGGSR